MEPEMSRPDFFAEELDDGSQALVANDDNSSRAGSVHRREPAKKDEVPILQRRHHAEPRYTNNPEAQQCANALNQADQSTGWTTSRLGG